MINLIVDNQPVSTSVGTTILEAAKQNNINIPHLCYLEGVHKDGSCRICVVEVEGEDKLQAACSVLAKEGMIVHTQTERVLRVRKTNYELLLSNYTCDQDDSNPFLDMGTHLGITKPTISGDVVKGVINITREIILNRSKCILCRRCVIVCNGILGAQNRAFDTVIGSGSDEPISAEQCSSCLRCAEVCPSGAIQKNKV